MLATVSATRFEDDGFVVVRQAFSPAVAAECRALLSAEAGCDPRAASTWTRMRITLDSRGRARLRFLCSDGGPDDAPPRLLVGSPLDRPRLVRGAGDCAYSSVERAIRRGLGQPT